MFSKKYMLFISALALLVFVGYASTSSNTNDERTTTHASSSNDNNTNPSPDFDGDGTVGLPDFLLFVNVFGLRQGDEGYEARFDLDGDGTIGIRDFLIFVNNFGKEIPAAVVAIPDAKLQAAIEVALGKVSGAAITEAEMKTLTRLDAPNANISDLTGLEFAINLTRLNLGVVFVEGQGINSNEISDLSPLSGMTNLKELDLSTNNITDRIILPLSNLTNLISLDLSTNNITDISPLAGLTNLKELNLFRNNISDISILFGLTNLTVLNLGDNNISDISPLAGMTNLTFLDLSGINITDISPLSGMINLTVLWLNNINITDISVLADLTNLTRLSLTGINITDISPLSGMTNLTQLILTSNNISDISPLSGMTNLTRLWINNLKNDITDISVLARLTKLTNLLLQNNNISDISPLAGMTNLTWLSLRDNNITDISPLSGMTNLKELYLSTNNISDISPLSGLTNLTRLEIRGNPLNFSSTNDHIPLLESRGATVQYDLFRKGDFDIELVFLTSFTERQKQILHWATRRWMAVVKNDLPDYEFTEGWSGQCGDHSFEIPSGERIDDLRIYVTGSEDGALGWARLYILREETHLPVVGCMGFNLARANLPITALHEIAHVLGFGSIWRRLGFYQNPPNGDTHFNGPLAIAAFDEAGGRDYPGAKVPVSGPHWRRQVFGQELMVTGGDLSAITIQSLADLGYVVDVTQADPYTLPGARASSKIAAALPSIPDPDITQTDTYTQCGFGLRREPIYVVDPQGRVIRTIAP